MEIPARVPEVAAWVGLDWADQRHEIRLQAVGLSQVESFTVEQKPEVLHDWIAELRVASRREKSPWLWSSRAGR